MSNAVARKVDQIAGGKFLNGDTRSPESADHGTVVYLWCPGCFMLHSLCVRMGIHQRHVWEWNEDLEKPTFNQSLLVTYGWTHPKTKNPTTKVCHSFVRDGQWEFLSDSTHKFAGQTIPLPPLPSWVQETE